MRWSRLFSPTLRETPAEAGAGRRLLLRAGYARQTAAGVYSYLCLGQRCLRKIAGIVGQEMDGIGAQEVSLPAFHPEAVAALARGELRSYKQLPQIWRQGDFRVHDSCSIDLDAAGLEQSFEKHRAACRRVFERCGVSCFAAQGGGESFMLAAEGGEDAVARCPACGYAARSEYAVSAPAPPALPDPEGDFDPEPFHTPDRKTIAAVAEFTGLPESAQMKSRVMLADGAPVLALVRGDHQMSEAKLAAALGARELRPALPGEIREWFGADAGSLGPVGAAKVRILADEALRGRRNMITGANRNDYHLKNVTPGEDFSPEFFDLRKATPGDSCGACGAPLEMIQALELGRVSEHAQATGLHVTNEAGAEVTPATGFCRVGIERVLWAAIELHHDADGIALPPSIAPFDVVVTPVNIHDTAQREAAGRIYQDCLDGGLEALLDDRDERPGVKFKDADLIGVPWRVVVGKKLAQGLVELVDRRTREKLDTAISEVAARVR